MNLTDCLNQILKLSLDFLIFEICSEHNDYKYLILQEQILFQQSISFQQHRPRVIQWSMLQIFENPIITMVMIVTLNYINYQRQNFHPQRALLMNDQLYNEESYVSLSAFLSLDKTNNEDFVSDPKLPPTTEDIQNNANFWDPKGDPLSDMEQDSDNQENRIPQKGGKQKKQRKDYSKNYRKRHKQYVQNLEKMNAKYEKRIQQLTLKLQQMAEQIQRLKYGRESSGNVTDNTFTKEKQMTLKQLVNQAENQKQSSWENIRKFALGYGFGGKQKINLLNYYMSQLLQNLLIDHNKMLMITALNDFQIIKPYAKTIHQIEQDLIGYSTNEFNYLKKFLRKSFGQMIKQFHKCGQNFYLSYVTLINQAQKIQNQFGRVWDSLGKMISPQKFIKVLKWYEQNKYCKEIQMLRKDWFQSFRN